MRVEAVNNIEPVSCPGCEKTRPAEPGLYFCSNCGTEFVVRE